MDDRNEKLKETFERADPQVKQVVLKVYQLENERLHMGNPKGIMDDIVDAIKQIVQ